MTLKLTFTLLIVCTLAVSAQGATRSSINGGNWSNAATWGGALPAPADDVVIGPGATVNLNQATANAIRSLTIQPGGTLRITVNGSSLHLAGPIVNNGALILWNSDLQKATFFLHADVYLSGSGTWNFGAVNLGDYQLDFDDNLVLSIADNITGTALSGINRIHQRRHTIFRFNGTENATLPADSIRYRYPSIAVAKSAIDLRTVSFADQPAKNGLAILGSIWISSVNDRLAIGGNNTLRLVESPGGNGTVSGGVTSMVEFRVSAANDTLRLTPGTFLNELSVIGSGRVVIRNPAVIRNRLWVDSMCTVRLPDSAVLTIGVNGTTPTKGMISGGGYLEPGTASSLNLRGNSSEPLVLRFAQTAPAAYTLDGLSVSRVGGRGPVRLATASTLAVNGALEIDTANSLDLNDGTLLLNLTITIRPQGYLTGSDKSTLIIQGSGGNATLRFNPTGRRHNRTLRLLEINRSGGRIITLADTLFIREELRLTSARLNCNGELVLLSDRIGSASLAPLGANADLIGDVTVQCMVSGGPGTRGTRMLSSPIDDAATPLTVYQQLQKKVLITGTGGVQNGFDAGGTGQPYAPTIKFYDERAGAGTSSFVTLPAIDKRYASSSYPGNARAIFLFYRGDRTLPTAKVNTSAGNYPVPETTTLELKGPVNKRDVPVSLSYTANAGDDYNGYNAVGNPYPAAIDWRKVERSGVADMISVIRPDGGMATYSNGVIINGDALPVIQPCQGFYIKALAPGAGLRFAETCKAVGVASARLLSKSPHLADRSGGYAGSSRYWVTIQITGTTNSEETAVVFTDDSSPGADDKDAAYFPGSMPGICTRSAQTSTVNAINFMPLPEDSVFIDLLIYPGDGQLSLSCSGMFLPEGYESWLVDVDRNRRVRIDAALNYQLLILQAAVRGIGGRFKLLFCRARTLSAQPGEAKSLVLYPVPVKDSLHVRFSGTASQHPDPVVITVYTLAGQKLFTGSGMSVDMATAAPGTYIAEIRYAGGRTERRKFLKN